MKKWLLTIMGLFPNMAAGAPVILFNELDPFLPTTLTLEEILASPQAQQELAAVPPSLGTMKKTQGRRNAFAYFTEQVDAMRPVAPDIEERILRIMENPAHELFTDGSQEQLKLWNETEGEPFMAFLTELMDFDYCQGPLTFDESIIALAGFRDQMRAYLLASADRSLQDGALLQRVALYNAAIARLDSCIPTAIAFIVGNSLRVEMLEFMEVLVEVEHLDGAIVAKFIGESLAVSQHKTRALAIRALQTEFWLGFYLTLYQFKDAFDHLNERFLEEYPDAAPVFSGAAALGSAGECIATKIDELSNQPNKHTGSCTFAKVEGAKNLFGQYLFAPGGRLPLERLRELGESTPNVVVAHWYAFTIGSLGPVDFAREILDIEMRVNRIKALGRSLHKSPLRGQP